MPNQCNTPCNHADLRLNLGALVDQVDGDGNIVTAGIMPSCEGEWTTDCDNAARQAHVRKPEICGGAWRNSVYDVTSNEMDTLVIDYSVVFQDEGCYIDTEHRDLKGDAIHMGSTLASPQACATLCAGGYSHFGLQNGHECFCGNTFGNTGGAAAAGECNMPCEGEVGTMCGGQMRNNIYSITDVGPDIDFTSTEIPVDYVYMGCYTDNGDRDMGPGSGNDAGSFSNMEAQASAHTCAEICYGYEHFGLQYHKQCFCDNSYNNDPHHQDFGTITGLVDPTDVSGLSVAVPTGCNTPCAHPDLLARLGALGRSNPECAQEWTPQCETLAVAARIGRPEICGGPNRNSVYDVTSESASASIVIDETLTFTSLGCYADSEHRTLGEDVVHMGARASRQLCATACNAGGYSLFGLQYYHECFCGNAIPNIPATADRECDTPCEGEPETMCGGAWRNSIYRLGGR